VANLARNAIEHTPAGGHITIRTSADDGGVTVAVADSGEGIAADEVDRVWEPFYRGDRSRQRGIASGDGAGLGLSIVRGIVEAHGGSVTVNSAAAAGTTFKIRLPR
jgi:two-component system sensor histidine kinase BaeS